MRDFKSNKLGSPPFRFFVPLSDSVCYGPTAGLDQLEKALCQLGILAAYKRSHTLLIHSEQARHRSGGTGVSAVIREALGMLAVCMQDTSYSEFGHLQFVSIKMA